MLSCKFCNKECKNDNSLRNHERLCSKNPNRQKTFFSDPKNHKTFIKKRSNQFQKAALMGMKYEVSKETRKKLSESATKQNALQSENTKKKRRQTIANKVANGEWHTSLAKRMHYRYKGIDLHGKWEYNYAIWLDENNIQWDRCKESFEYTFDNKIRRYTPDFYLNQSDTYVEVKGYKTEKDIAKWDQFPKHRTLKILMKEDLIKLGIKLD